MRFGFIAKHRAVWPVRVLCKVLEVSASGYYEWFGRQPSKRLVANTKLTGPIRQSFEASDRTYGSRRVWRDVLAWGEQCGIHRVARLMRAAGLAARRKRRRSSNDTGVRPEHSIAPNLRQRAFEADAPNKKWLADFMYIWTAEGWLFVAVVLDLYSRRIVGWSMKPEMTAQLVIDALVMAVWRRGMPKELLHHSDQGSQLSGEPGAAQDRTLALLQQRLDVLLGRHRPSVFLDDAVDDRTDLALGVVGREPRRARSRPRRAEGGQGRLRLSMPMTGLSNPNRRLVNLGVALTQQYGVALHHGRDALELRGLARLDPLVALLGDRAANARLHQPIGQLVHLSAGAAQRGALAVEQPFLVAVGLQRTLRDVEVLVKLCHAVPDQVPTLLVTAMRLGLSRSCSLLRAGKRFLEFGQRLGCVLAPLLQLLRIHAVLAAPGASRSLVQRRGRDHRLQPSRRSSLCAATLTSRETSSTEALSGGSNLATTSLLNVSAYRPTSSPHRHPRNLSVPIGTTSSLPRRNRVRGTRSPSRVTRPVYAVFLAYPYPL